MVARQRGALQAAERKANHGAVPQLADQLLAGSGAGGPELGGLLGLAVLQSAGPVSGNVQVAGFEGLATRG